MQLMYPSFQEVPLLYRSAVRNCPTQTLNCFLSDFRDGSEGRGLLPASVRLHSPQVSKLETNHGPVLSQ